MCVYTQGILESGTFVMIFIAYHNKSAGYKDFSIYWGFSKNLKYFCDQPLVWVDLIEFT